MPAKVLRNTTWRFKEGRGDRYRRLRVLNVQSESDKTGPYVEVRSFYLNEPILGEGNQYAALRKHRNPRRQPKTIILLKDTLLKDYECLNTHVHEGASGEVLSEISSREFMP